jgi:hypothetical protein
MPHYIIHSLIHLSDISLVVIVHRGQSLNLCHSKVGVGAESFRPASANCDHFPSSILLLLFIGIAAPILVRCAIGNFGNPIFGEDNVGNARVGGVLNHKKIAANCTTEKREKINEDTMNPS